MFTFQLSENARELQLAQHSARSIIIGFESTVDIIFIVAHYRYEYSTVIEHTAIQKETAVREIIVGTGKW